MRRHVGEEKHTLVSEDTHRGREAQTTERGEM